jgi:hypothetical protein
MSSNVEYLLSLGAIRERAAIVGEAAKSGGLQHFDLHDDKIQDVAKFVANVIKVCTVVDTAPWTCAYAYVFG